MAVLITLALVTILLGGGFLKLCFAIRREDHPKKYSLEYGAPTFSTRAARAVTGISSSRWD